jgi:hypothetical protein
MLRLTILVLAAMVLVDVKTIHLALRVLTVENIGKEKEQCVNIFHLIHQVILFL